MVYSKPRAGRWQSWASGPWIALHFIACAELHPHGMAGRMIERMNKCVLFTHRGKGRTTCYFLLELEVVSLGLLAWDISYCYCIVLTHADITSPLS